MAFIGHIIYNESILMKRFLLTVWIVLTAFVAVGQTNVEIVGEVTGGAGKKVVLGAYSDMLTQREVVLDSVRVDDEGRFSLRCYANYPRLVFVQIEYYSQSFYIEPSRRYEVYVPEFDWDMSERQNVFLDPVALPLEFLGIDSSELNLKIMWFEETVDSFLTANRDRIDFRYGVDKRAWRQLEGMFNSLNLSGEGVGIDGFYERYVRYRLLEMRLALRLSSRKQLVRKYIENEPIRYYDENYMRFFLALFEHSIVGKESAYRVTQTEGDELDMWLDMLGQNPLLKNEQVRELAALQALKEMYFTKGYDREWVKRMTQSLGAKTKFVEHKDLARRLETLWSEESEEQSLAKRLTFDLPDVDRNRVSLDHFRGKWVYLSFVRTGDPNSIKEIETMAHLRDTVYGKYPEVVFVSVVCDREFQKMYHFLKNSRRGARCNWTWLHFDGDYEMLERWQVTSYPTFVLLDPEGRRVYDYTPAPASGILLYGPWIKNR